MAAGDEDGGVLDRGGDDPHTAAPRGIPQTLDHPADGGRAVGGEGDLRRPDGQAVGEHLTGLVQQPSGGARLGVQPPRVGPPGVDRGEEGVAGAGVHGTRCGVEDRAPGTTVRTTVRGGVRHTPTLAAP